MKGFARRDLSFSLCGLNENKYMGKRIAVLFLNTSTIFL